VCRFCRAIQEGNCVDVVEMDAASETSIDDVRTSIIENAKYPPMEARYKIYIIDEVHDLSAKAFDALLKTIEEPPPHVVFILATTEFHRVPPTIRSRCQRFDFHRGTIADITRRLEQVLAAEGFTAEPAALHLVARAADGSWRDALTALEQVIAFSEGGTITAQTVYNALGLLEDETLMQLTDALLERDAGRALQLLEGQMLLGREPRVFAESLIQHWRALIQAALHAHDRAGAYDPTVWSAMIEQARRAGVPRLLAWWEQMAGALSEMRTSGSPRAILELYLLRLACEPTSAPPTDAPAPQYVASVQPAAPTPRPVPPASTPRATPPAATPEPAPRASQPAPPTDSATALPVDPATANQLWQQRVEELVQRSPAGGMHLRGSRLELDGDRVRLVMPTRFGYEYFKQQARREANLIDEVRKTLGAPNAPVQLVYSDEARPEEPPLTPPPPAERELEGEELVDELMRALNGHEVDAGEE